MDFISRLFQAKDQFERRSGELVLEVGSAVSELELKSLVRELRIELPPSYAAFLRACGSLYVTPDDDSTALEVLRPPEVIRQTREFASMTQRSSANSIWCAYGPETDWIVLNPVFRTGGEFAVCAGTLDDLDAVDMEESIIARSFGEFFERALSSIASGSEYGALYWLDATAAS